MINQIKQIVAVSAINLQCLRFRLGTSSVIVIGMAGVVAVMISVLAMSNGLDRSFANTGRADRVIVLSGGAETELFSQIERTAAVTIADAPGIRRAPGGEPIASAEPVVLVTQEQRAGGLGNVTLRGLGSAGNLLRPEVKLVAGRMFERGRHEMIAGVDAQSRFQGLQPGDRLTIDAAEWQIVGTFESHGDMHGSELMADAETVLSAYGHESFQSVSVLLDTPEAFDTLRAKLTTDPTLSVRVLRESEYYAEQAKPVVRVLRSFAFFVSAIMAVGALFGALNSMYSALSTRIVEIATLRAIGFGAGAVVVSVFLESILLALVGAVLGAVLAAAAFNGHAFSMSGGGVAQPQLTFALAVSARDVVTGIVWACLVGLIGGMFPAIRSARLPVATGLRAT